MFGFIKEALSGSTGASSRRLGYLFGITALCTALLFVCGSVGYLVAVAPLAKASALLPQLCSSLEMLSGIIATSITTGYIMKKRDESNVQ